ncbi:MAG TPA: tRNA (adenosine(37)-N6)-threonylcarbamoyltransferase complex dimerization subunit type 1 TsaB [Acidimicrobiales bacterium]|nr:tRNA (adenosine(37)-N6)-threonylcarbamoyltransferase complex dimerization subunit type 1 TsaB [Acidimicrobiales bacterium]
MLTLAIATATEQVGVAIGRAGGPVSSLHLQQGRRHGEVLAPAIQSLMRLSHTTLREVELIAVDTGPGLFTGLRVGVATAKALASALGVPVAACSSLELLAAPHAAAGLAVVSVVDARRGEVFWQSFHPEPVGDAQVTPPEVLVAALEDAGGPVIVAGDGARRYAPLLEQVEGVAIAGPEHDHPSAAVLVELAATRPGLSPEKITPEYMRGADVRIGWEQRDA